MICRRGHLASLEGDATSSSGTWIRSTANAEPITLQKMASAPVTSPQAIGAHTAATAQSAGATAATQSATAVIAENGANVAGAAV